MEKHYRHLLKNELEKTGYGGMDSLISFHDISDRDFYEKLPSDVKEHILRLGEGMLDEDIPALCLSDYMRFSKDGNREAFEERYFLRRHMLTWLTLAECVEDKGRFVPKLLDVLYAILEETTWCLPAHNTYIRDAIQLPLPDKDRPVIDLFAAHTAAIAGMTEYLLHERFKDISPYISSYVDREIRERILEPYLNYHFWWMGADDEDMCNWTPWITQNVLICVFTRKSLCFTEDELKLVLKKAVSSIDHFLDDYGDDGCCSEGAGYYSHAGLCYFGCLELLGRISHGLTSGLFKADISRSIASYIVRIYAGGGYYFNYADCSPYPGRRSARDYLFAIYTGLKDYEDFCLEDMRLQDIAVRGMSDEDNIYYHMLRLESCGEIDEKLSLKEGLCKDKKAPGPAAPLKDVYFESTGVFITRDKHFALAVKAGCNGDSHNHNDVGSLILYKDQRPFLIDLGVETYTKKTFSKDRYDIWTMQSQYHNTVNFSDDKGNIAYMQKAGEQYGAGSVSYGSGTESSFISMDLSPAYADPNIRKCIRSVSHIKGSHISLKDEYEGEYGLIQCFITYEEAFIKRRAPKDTMKGSLMQAGDKIMAGSLGSLTLLDEASVTIERLKIGDKRLKEAWKHDCFRIIIRPLNKSMSLRIE